MKFEQWRPLPYAFFATILLNAIPRVVSQGSFPTCVLASYQWSFNSHKQSPCAVASSLLGVCSGGSYDVQPLPTDSHYLGPTIDGANPCQCSTVAYSMLSACAGCQNRTITSWSEWTTNCARVSINSFPDPISEGTFVPGWAYLDVKTADVFDPIVAKQGANITESTAAPRPTSTSSSKEVTSTTSTSSTQAAASSSAATAEAFNDAHANAVGGAVVGGLAGLTMILISIVLFYLHIRRRRKVASAEAPPADVPPVSPLTSEKSDERGSEGQVPDLVIHPPVLPFYQTAEPSSPGAYSNSTMSPSASEGSLVKES